MEEPEIARCKVERLVSAWTAYIDITVTNDGGKATYNFVVPPQSPDAMPDVAIACDGLAGSHTSNANVAYDFVGKTPDGATDIRWDYRLLSYDNRMETYRRQTGGDSFEVPAITPIDDISQWMSDENRCLSGEVLLTCKSGDVTVGSVYPLVIELKPAITAVKEIEKAFSADGLTYDLSFTVDFAGSDAVGYDIRQNSPSFYPRHETVYADGSARCRADNLTCAYDAEIEISVENQYGTATQTLNFAPQDPKDPSGVADLSVEDARLVEVYGCDGRRILTADGMNAVETLPAGVYLLRKSGPSGEVVTLKYFKK